MIGKDGRRIDFGHAVKLAQHKALPTLFCEHQYASGTLRFSASWNIVLKRNRQVTYTQYAPQSENAVPRLGMFLSHELS